MATMTVFDNIRNNKKSYDDNDDNSNDNNNKRKRECDGDIEDNNGELEGKVVRRKINDTNYAVKNISRLKNGLVFNNVVFGTTERQRQRQRIKVSRKRIERHHHHHHHHHQRTTFRTNVERRFLRLFEDEIETHPDDAKEEEEEMIKKKKKNAAVSFSLIAAKPEYVPEIGSGAAAAAAGATAGTEFVSTVLVAQSSLSAAGVGGATGGGFTLGIGNSAPSSTKKSFRKRR